MSERVLLFLFTALIVACSLSFSAWMLWNGDAANPGGLFLAIAGLIVAAVFTLDLAAFGRE